MADNLSESNPGSGGVQPSTQPSPGGVSSTSGDVDALAKVLRPIIAEEVARAQQSAKDKRIGKLETAVGGFAEQLAQLKEWQSRGFTEQQALSLMQLTQPAAPVEAEQPKVQGSTPAAPNVDAQAVFRAMGFDPGGAEVTAVLRQTSDPLAQIAALATMKQAKANPANTPAPATMQPAGGGSAMVVSTSELEKEYRNLTAKLPGGQAGVKARFDAKIAIRKKAQEAGIPSPV